MKTALVLVALGMIWAAVLIPPLLRRRPKVGTTRADDVVELRQTPSERLLVAGLPVIGVPLCLAFAYFGRGSEHVVFALFAVGLLLTAPRLLGAVTSDEPIVRVDRQGLRIQDSWIAWEQVEGIVIYRLLWYGPFAAVVQRPGGGQSRPRSWALRFDEAAAGYALWSGIPLKPGADGIWRVFEERGVTRLTQKRGAWRRMLRALLPFGSAARG